MVNTKRRRSPRLKRKAELPRSKRVVAAKDVTMKSKHESVKLSRRHRRSLSLKSPKKRGVVAERRLTGSWQLAFGIHLKHSDQAVVSAVEAWEKNANQFVASLVNLILQAGGFLRKVSLCNDSVESCNLKEAVGDVLRTEVATKIFSYKSFVLRKRSSVDRGYYCAFFKTLGAHSDPIICNKKSFAIIQSYFQQIVTFGLPSVRHCGVVACLEFTLQLAETVGEKRKDCVNQFRALKSQSKDYRTLDECDAFLVNFESLLDGQGCFDLSQWDSLERARKDPSRKKQGRQTAVQKLAANLFISLRLVRDYTKAILDFLDQVFQVGWKDEAKTIREEVVLYVGKFIDCQPQVLCATKQVKYLGWLLADRCTRVRVGAIEAISKLLGCSRPVDRRSKSLWPLLGRFKPKLLLQLDSTEHQVVAATLRCLQAYEANSEAVPECVMSNSDLFRMDSLIFQSLVDRYDATQPELGPSWQTVITTALKGFLLRYEMLDGRKQLASLKKFIVLVQCHLTSEQMVDYETISLDEGTSESCQESSRTLELLATPVAYSAISNTVKYLLPCFGPQKTETEQSQVPFILDAPVILEAFEQLTTTSHRLILSMIVRAVFELLPGLEQKELSLDCLDPDGFAVIQGASSAKPLLKTSKLVAKYFFEPATECCRSLAQSLQDVLRTNFSDHLCLRSLVSTTHQTFGFLESKNDQHGLLTLLLEIGKTHSDKKLFEVLVAEWRKTVGGPTGESGLGSSKTFGQFDHELLSFTEALQKECVQNIDTICQEDCSVEVREENEIWLSHQLFKLFTLYKSFATLCSDQVLSTLVQSLKKLLPALLHGASVIKLSELGDEERRQSIMCCRIFIVHHSLKLLFLNLVVRVWGMRRSTATQLADNPGSQQVEAMKQLSFTDSVRNVQQEVESYLKFLKALLSEKPDAFEELEEDLKDLCILHLSEIRILFSKKQLGAQLSCVFSQANLTDVIYPVAEESESGALLIQQSALTADLNRQVYKTMLKVFHVRIEDLRDDLEESNTKRLFDDAVNTEHPVQDEASAPSFVDSTRLALFSDLRSVVTTNALLVPKLKEVIFADVSTTEELKQAAFLLQYCQDNHHFVAEAIEISVKLLLNGDVSILPQIFLVVMKLGYKKIAKTSEHLSEAAKKECFQLLESLVSRLCNCFVGTASADKLAEEKAENAIRSLFQLAVDHALLVFPKRLGFLRVVVPIVKLAKSFPRKNQANRPLLVQALRTAWVQRVKALGRAHQILLFGSSEEAGADVDTVQQLQKLLGVSISLAPKTVGTVSPVPKATSPERASTDSAAEIQQNVFSEDESTGRVKECSGKRKKAPDATESPVQVLDLFDDNQGHKQEEEKQKETPTGTDDFVGFLPQRRKRR